VRDRHERRDLEYASAVDELRAKIREAYNACRDAGLKCIRAIGAELREKLRGLEH
jgi:hypothetical protein